MTWRERIEAEGWTVADKEAVHMFNYCVGAFGVDELFQEKQSLSIKHSVPTTNVVPIGFLESWQEARRG